MFVHDHLPLETCNAWPRRSPRSGSGSATRPSSSPPRAAPPPESPGPWAVAAAPSRTGSPATTAAARRPSGAAPPRPPATPGRAGAGPLPRAARGRAHARGRRLHLLRATISAASWSDEFGVILELAGGLRPAAPPRLQQPDAPAPAQGRRRGAAGDLQGGRRRPDPGHRARPTPSEEVQVWFEDEARFGQQGTLTRVWARTGLAAARRCGRTSTAISTC